MRAIVNYYLIISLITTIGIGGLFFLKKWTDNSFPVHTEANLDFVEGKAREVTKILAESVIFSIFVEQGTSASSVVSARLNKYLDVLRANYGYRGLALISLETDSVIVHAASGDVTEIESHRTFFSKDPGQSKIRFNQYAVFANLPVSKTKDADGQQFVLYFEMETDSVQPTEVRANKQLSFLIDILLVFIVVSSAAIIILRRSNYNRLKLVEAALILVLGFYTGWWLKLVVEYRSQIQREKVFQSFADNKLHSLRDNLRGVVTNMGLIQSFFEASDEVTGAEFRHFASGIMRSNSFYNAFSIIEASVEPATTDAAIVSKLQQAHCALKSENESDLNATAPEQDPLLVSLIDSAACTGLVYSAISYDLKSCGDRGASLLIVLPMFVPGKRLSPGEHKFIAAFVDLQELLNKTMSDGNEANKYLPLGLAIQSLQDPGTQEWLASYPPEHLAYHTTEPGMDNHESYSLSVQKPLFLGGVTFFMTTHDSPEFSEFIPAASGNFILLIITLLSFVLAALVYRFRLGWDSLEEAVALRTAQLNLRVRELELLRELSHQLTQNQNLEDVLSWLCNQFNSDEVLNREKFAMVINFRGNTLCGALLDRKPDARLTRKFDINETDGVAGTIKLFVLDKQLEKDKEELNESFLNQIAFVLNSWLAYTHAQQKLSEAEERFTRLVETSFDGIYLLENDRFVWVNQAFADMVEYPLETLTSPDFDPDRLLTDKAHEISQERKAMRERGELPPARFDFQQLTASGKVLDVEVSLVTDITPGKKTVFGIVRDVTEQRRLNRALHESEERLQQQNEELQLMNEELTTSNAQMRELNLALSEAYKRAEAGDKLKSAFLNNISHEVRTPLNGICGAAEILSDPELDLEEKLDMIEILNMSTRRLLRTITQYMDISLLDSGNMPVVATEFRFLDFMNPLLNDYENQCKTKGLAFEFRNHLGDCMLHSDKSLYEKVIGHLLDNAVKFTSEGKVEVIAARDGDFIHIQIHDTGKGMDKKFHPRIFDLFMQEDISDKRRYDGSGLGLPIVKRITELLNGKISFESELGKGSTFEVRLPAQFVESTKLEPVFPEPVEHPHILVAEDEDSNFMVLKLLLERRYKAKISRAWHGEQAVNIAQHESDIKLVLMDIKMPVMDGYEATKLIKTLRPDLPVIAITAYALSGDDQKAYAAGCNDYLPKPIQANLMFEKVNRLLNIPGDQPL
ncbi:MAG: response regulator [Bacteroidetes bacterium]|nr:response regulator [Bacteroidota bacterium]